MGIIVDPPLIIVTIHNLLDSFGLCEPLLEPLKTLSTIQRVRLISRTLVGLRPTAPLPSLSRASHQNWARYLSSDLDISSNSMTSATVDALKTRIAEIGGQIRIIKQGGPASSSSVGSLESLQAEVKELKIQLGKAEKEHNAEMEKHKITLKVPKVSGSAAASLPVFRRLNVRHCQIYI